MVAVNGLKWGAAIMCLATAASAVGVGLPWWLEVSYSGTTPTIYARQGVWQTCISFGGGTLTCSDYTPATSSLSLARYLATGGAGGFFVSAALILTYACQCARTQFLSVSSLILGLAGAAAGGAGTGLYYASTTFTSSNIGIGGIIQFIGLGLGFIACLVILGSILSKENPNGRKTPPPSYVRNERRVRPQQQEQQEQPPQPAQQRVRDETAHYLDRYKEYQNRYKALNRDLGRQDDRGQYFDRRNLVY